MSKNQRKQLGFPVERNESLADRHGDEISKIKEEEVKSPVGSG